MRRLELKTCQCGRKPVWTPVKNSRKPGRRSAASPEKIVCQVCGNSAGPGSSREHLADEWNSAGWCGQSQPDKPAVVPFGPQWKAQCLRTKKADLIGLLESALRRGLWLDGLVAKLRGELGEMDRLVAKLRQRRERSELATAIDRLVERGVIKRGEAAGAKLRVMKGAGK